MAQPAVRPAVRPRARERRPTPPGEDDNEEATALTSGERARLAAVAREVAAEWGLALGTPFPAYYSFVAPAGDDAVLKVVSESDDESTHEAEALRFWCGDGAVRLVRHDAVRRALLLERAVPGQDASALHDAEALPIALRVGERLWRLTERARPYEAVTDRVPAWLGHAGAHELVAAARHIYERLAPRTGILVHGDLHHHNLLRHGGRWVAIDPKPILGEPEYDVVTLLWNPIGHVPTRSSVEGRIALLAEGGLDPERMRAWAIVRGVSLGLPLGPSETEDDPPQLRVARLLLESR